MEKTTDLNDYLTVPEAAKRYGVTRQRMHQLIEYYEAETIYLHRRMRLIHKTELKKIPTKRPNGRHVYE